MVERFWNNKHILTLNGSADTRKKCICLFVSRISASHIFSVHSFLWVWLKKGFTLTNPRGSSGKRHVLQTDSCFFRFLRRFLLANAPFLRFGRAEDPALGVPSCCLASPAAIALCRSPVMSGSPAEDEKALRFQRRPRFLWRRKAKVLVFSFWFKNSISLNLLNTFFWFWGSKLLGFSAAQITFLGPTLTRLVPNWCALGMRSAGFSGGVVVGHGLCGSVFYKTLWFWRGLVLFALLKRFFWMCRRFISPASEPRYFLGDSGGTFHWEPWAWATGRRGRRAKSSW